ncbi:MAG: hypothetical protein LBB40_00750 [Holophagales bacterium]|jgi:hypothetical protein|nr:hypothetical protein [Holophagales bacterium]
MRGFLSAIITIAIALLINIPATAQSLLTQWKNVRPAWEASLDVGDGQKVRQAAEVLLRNPDIQIRQSNYNEMHAKVAVLGIAARGAVLEGDWPGAASLLEQAAETAQFNYAATSEILLELRRQHEAKILDWRELIQPQEEQLRWLKDQPGLRSEQIDQRAQIESFLAEHNNAVSNSEQSIKDIDEILYILKTEHETCAKSLIEWSDFLLKERTDIQELGSSEKYVTEKLAQVQGDGNRSSFERISYARRLLRLDPKNQSCQQFLNTLLDSVKKVEPAANQNKAPQNAAKNSNPAKSVKSPPPQKNK